MNDQEFITRARQLCTPRPAADTQPGGAAMAAAIINSVAAAAEANVPRDNEAVGKDGLLYCLTCGGPRQTIVTPPFDGAKPRAVRCMCQCKQAEEDRRKARERQEAADRRRSICFQGTGMAGWSFANDDRQRPELSDAAKRYAEQFREHLKSGKGLLFYGPVGTGKTYLAACIANAVIDQGYRALMTNFATVADELFSVEDKAGYIRDMCKYDLMILDDLGVERKTEYMQEMVYKIIDARYRAGGPVIITTNLTPEELTQAADIGYTRVYDRILERCLAVKMDGASRRMQAAVQNKHTMRKQLGMEV